MKTFKVSIPCNPKNSDQWFSAQHLVEHHGIEAENQDAAQHKLDVMCRDAGTDSDPHFDSSGPAAIE